jgi:hypothetical protein
VNHCVDYLEANALKTQGLFQNSSTKTVNEISRQVDNGIKVEFSTIKDPRTIMTLLKKFFRELTEPLLPYALFGVVMAMSENLAAAKQSLKSVIDQLPNANKATFKLLILLFRDILEYSDVRKHSSFSSSGLTKENNTDKYDHHRGNFRNLWPCVAEIIRPA